MKIATSCLICDEDVEIFSIKDTIKICDKCKAVVLKLREQEEQKERSGGDMFASMFKEFEKLSEKEGDK